MDHQQSPSPYKPLGKRLKALRDKAKESLAEASGAVEIDVKQLASYELGRARPSEDVLLLLISHFGALDDEAVRLWELAGYGLPAALPAPERDKSETKPTQEGHILFTDIVDIMVNNYGVVMNFMQSRGPNSNPTTVSRVGMSREHAKSVLQILQATLAQTERNVPKLPKKLISPEPGTPDESRNN